MDLIQLLVRILLKPITDRIPSNFHLLKLVLPMQFLLLVAGLAGWWWFEPVISFGTSLTFLSFIGHLIGCEVLLILGLAVIRKVFQKVRVPEHMKKATMTIRESTGEDRLFVSAMVGFNEELFFRGVLLPFIGPWQSSAIFSLIHRPICWFHFMAIMFAGLLFAQEVVISGGLLLPIAHHALHDWLMFSIIKALPENEFSKI